MTCWCVHTRVEKITFWDGMRKAEPNLLTVAVNAVTYTPSLKRERIVRSCELTNLIMFDGIQLKPGELSFGIGPGQEPAVSGIEVSPDRLIEHSYRATLQDLWPDPPRQSRSYGSSGKPLCVVVHEPDGAYRLFRDAHVIRYAKTGHRALFPHQEQYEVGVQFYSDPELHSDAPWLSDDQEVIVDGD